MRKSTKVPFQLLDIETLQWAIHPENYIAEMDDFNMSFKSGFEIEADYNLVHCIPKISLSYNNKTFLVVETAFTFIIDSGAWSNMVSDDMFVLPKALKEHFLVLAIGTLRGIIFEKTNTKKLETIVLPTIDVRHGTGDDLEFSLGE